MNRIANPIVVYIMILEHMNYKCKSYFCISVDGSVEGRKLYQNGTRRTASGRGMILLQLYYLQSSPPIRIELRKNGL